MAGFSSSVPAHFKGVKELIESRLGDMTSIPKAYIRPLEHEDRSALSSAAEESSIPIIDLSQKNETALVQQIGQACKEWGFFQVVNHGVPSRAIEEMFCAARQFHALPSEQKMKHFSTDKTSKMRYGTSFNVLSDNVLNWRDFLRHECSPFSEIRELLPEVPASYREAVGEYSEHASALGKLLLALISKSLGLAPDYIHRVLAMEEASQVIALNYYPPCPQPELALGLPRHSDPGTITLLMQDSVGGLQVLHHGKWVDVKPVPNAFIVNLADQLQILTNDRYKSVEHRAVVNTSCARMSLAYDFGPSWETLVQPAPELVKQDGSEVYRPSRYKAFMEKIQGGSLDQKHAFFNELKK